MIKYTLRPCIRHLNSVRDLATGTSSSSTSTFSDISTKEWSQLWQRGELPIETLEKMIYQVNCPKKARLISLRVLAENKPLTLKMMERLIHLHVLNNDIFAILKWMETIPLSIEGYESILQSLVTNNRTRVAFKIYGTLRTERLLVPTENIILIMLQACQVEKNPTHAERIFLEETPLTLRLHCPRIELRYIQVLASRTRKLGHALDYYYEWLRKGSGYTPLINLGSVQSRVQDGDDTDGGSVQNRAQDHNTDDTWKDDDDPILQDAQQEIDERNPFENDKPHPLTSVSFESILKDPELQYEHLECTRALMEGCAHAGHSQRAQLLWRKIRASGVSVDEPTLIHYISVFTNSTDPITKKEKMVTYVWDLILQGSVDDVHTEENEIIKVKGYRELVTVPVLNAIMQLLGSAGLLKNVMQTWDSFSSLGLEYDISSYETLLESTKEDHLLFSNVWSQLIVSKCEVTYQVCDMVLENFIRYDNLTAVARVLEVMHTKKIPLRRDLSKEAQQDATIARLISTTSLFEKKKSFKLR